MTLLHFRTEDDLYFGLYNIAKLMKSNVFSNITQQLLQSQKSTKELKTTKPDTWFRFKRESNSISNQMLIEPKPYFELVMGRTLFD